MFLDYETPAPALPAGPPGGFLRVSEVAPAAIGPELVVHGGHPAFPVLLPVSRCGRVKLLSVYIGGCGSRVDPAAVPVGRVNSRTIPGRDHCDLSMSAAAAADYSSLLLY